MFLGKKAEEVRVLLNREPYQLPPINIKKIGRTDFKGIENWFVDRALFITSLSKFWSNVVYKLGTSIKPGQAILGKEEWLFLGNDYAASIDQYTGKNKPTEEEILLKLSVLKQMNDLARQNNIPFLVAIAPDKQEIYPEYLPNNIHKGSSKNRLELLQEAMLANGIDFVNLKQKEIEAKNILGKQYGDLYLKGDSHWNYLGAYAAYQAISDYMLKKGLQSRRLQFNFIRRQTTYSDLTNFLQLTHIKSNNPLPDVSNLKIDLFGRDIAGKETKLTDFQGNPNGVILVAPYENINKAIKNKQTCLLIGDSFSESLSFYFHNDFYNTVRIHSGNTSWNLSDLIQKYHPDLIVYEKVERDLLYPLVNFQITAHQVNFPKIPKQAFAVNGQIDKFKIEPDKITVQGWAYIPGLDAGKGEVYLKLATGSQTYFYSMNKIQKQSVSLAFKQDGNHLDLAGFSGTILRKDLSAGTYEVSLVVVNDNVTGEMKLPNTYMLG
nr:alginate O-acetyltransferase [Legionella norrlandica]